jgi:hypothetical protein
MTTSPVDLETDPNRGLVHGEAPSASKLKINGPAQVHVGQASDAFTLLLDEQPVVGTWTVDSGEAKLHPETGSNATLTATKEGPITLSARHDGATAPASVVAVPMPEHGMLPFVGGGYGGITIAVLAVSVGGALTAINLLNGAALATLLGTVVAYFFVQRPAASGSQQTRTNGHTDAGS